MWDSDFLRNILVPNLADNTISNKHKYYRRIQYMLLEEEIFSSEKVIVLKY